MLQLLAQPSRKIQPKLTIGEPNDKYEQEADKVADQVVSGSSPKVQMMCAECAKEEEEEVRMQPLEEEEEELQMKPVSQMSSGGEQDAPAGLSEKLQASQGGGKPIPESVEEEMGIKMGADFSEVKIHHDARAAEMSSDLGAQAFTHGKDIYFNTGKYNPNATAGKHLLAHELTHTIQQSKSSFIQRLIIGTENAPVPQGTTIHVGLARSAEWLQGHRNAGNPVSEAVTFVFVGSSLSSQTTTDIAARCNLQNSFTDRIICLHNEVHDAVMALEGRDGDLTDGDYVCRNYAAAVHDVSQQMGLSPDWETSTTHAWVEFTDGGTQYVVDAFNEILFSHPVR